MIDNCPHTNLGLVIEFPPDLDPSERGKSSQEKNVQEERENSTLGALYMDGDIPSSPGEPSSQIPIEQVDKDIRVMVAGADIQPFFQLAMNVSDLVSQLSAAPGSTPGDVNMSGSVNGNNPGSQDMRSMSVSDAFTGADAGGLDFSRLGVDSGTLASIVASLGFGVNLGTVAGLGPDVNANSNSNMLMDMDGAGYNGSQGWNSYSQQQQQQQQQQYSDYGGGYDERERDDRGGYDRGGRGGSRGRGRGGPRGRGGSAENKSRRRCNYYAQGRRVCV